MAQMSRNFFVLFLLCVVLLIIVGVAFPSYLSRKNAKLRSTFNSSVVTFNTLTSDKLISDGLEAVKEKRRAKRETLDNDSELFNWNFNISVTRYKKANEEKSKDLNASVKRSGVAVYLESKEPKEIAFNEMQAAFKSVRSFFRDFFNANFENATNDTKGKVGYFTESPWLEPGHTSIHGFNDDSTKTLSEEPDMEENETDHSSNKSLQSSEQISSENVDKLKLDSGRNDSSNQTDRGARIFFGLGLFNLGGKSLRKTTPEPETTLKTSDDADSNIATNENLPDPIPLEAFTVNPQQVSSIHANPLRSGTELSVIQPNEQKADKSDLLFATQQEDCLGCNTDKTENTNFPKEQDSPKTALETTSKPMEHLPDRTLRNLCMQILSNLEKSQTPFNAEEKAENHLRSSQDLSNHSLNSLIPNEVKELNTHVEIDNFISSEESQTEDAMSLGKQARFLSIFGLGSGRSEIINEGNLIFEKEPDEPKFTNLPSVSDCEKFSKDWKMEMVPKRDHASDLNTTSSIHELVILEDNPILASENTKEEFNLDENKTSFGTEVSFGIDKDLREVKNEDTNTEENNESSDELVESEIIDPNQNVQNTTDGQRDGRLFSFLGFGSGNGADANNTGIRSILGIFGSGMRSLDSNESDRNNDLGSGIPFQGEVSVDGDYPSEKDMYYPSEKDIFEDRATSAQEGRFLGIFGIGSGEGREIADSTDSITQNFLLTNSSEAKDILNVTDYGCYDCDYENFINLRPVTETGASSSIIEPTEPYENIHFDNDHDSPIHSRTSTDVFGINYQSTEKFDYGQSTENSVIELGSTENKSRRFMGTIFLTGSGDGGLFGDDGGPINLVEEENTVVSNRNPRRRGRLNDIDASDYFDGFPQTPIIDLTNSQDLVPSTDRPKDSFATDESRTEDFSQVTVVPFPNITQIQIKTRSCSGARDCNDTLNERCITVSASSICDCGRSFVRHKDTGKCVAKRLVETSLKLPEESFDEDLRNPASPRYKQMSAKSLDTIYLLLNENPEILRLVTDVNVAGFASGSLIVKLNFVLADAEKEPSRNLKDMENKLQKALRDENVLKRASLNVKNASFQPLKSEVNQCKSSELNYCSRYANCIRNEDYPGGFFCKCKEHYFDVSTNEFYPGEICVAKCPASFCGTNGHCEVVGNGKMHCICYGLYFGEKCEYPGVVVLGSLSIVALVSLILVFVVVLKLRCKSRSSGRTPTFRRADTPGHAIANCRVSDAIALGESREMKVSKFTQISTPVQEPPLIKVTRPTLNESSISFDPDSTFDTSNITDEKTV